jgi:hypothetical protein
MELSRPKVFGHSFVKRLHRDLRSNFDIRAALSFNIQRASVKLHGIGGRTVDKLIAFDLDKVRYFGLPL